MLQDKQVLFYIMSVSSGLMFHTYLDIENNCIIESYKCVGSINKPGGGGGGGVRRGGC